MSATLESLEKEIIDLTQEFQDKSSALETENQNLNIAQSLQSQHATLVARVDSLQRFTATQTSNNNNSNFACPTYDSTSMTPEHFISEAEEYFACRNVHRTTWHLVVGRMLPENSDVSRWWYVTKATVTDWDHFKVQFRTYESSQSSADTLREQLFSKRQKLEEAFESYAWDLFALFRRIDPMTSEESVVNRILNSCLPEIAVLLNAGSHQTVAELIVDTRQVITNINKVRKVEGRPLLRARQTDPVVTKQTGFTRRSFYSSNSKVENRLPVVNKPTVEASTKEPVASSSSSSKFCSLHNKPGHSDSECRAQLWKKNGQTNTTQTPKN